MNYKIISERPPRRLKIAKTLRLLPVNGNGIAFNISEVGSVRSEMSRLKKNEKLQFTSTTDEKQINVWAVPYEDDGIN